MTRILILQSYEDYRSNLIEYFESLGYLVFSELSCKSAFWITSEYEFEIVICDLDDEFKSDFKYLIEFLNEESVKNSHVFFISTKFKEKSEIIPLNIEHKSFFIINGKRMNEITRLIEKILPPQRNT